MPLFLGLKLRGIMYGLRSKKMALVQILLLLFPFLKSSQTDHFSITGSRKKKKKESQNYEQRKQQRQKEEREEEGGCCFKSQVMK